MTLLPLALVMVLALVQGSSGEQQNLTTEKETSECPAPFITMLGVCLYVDPVTEGTWPDMFDYCQSLGGNLISFTDANLFGAVVRYINSQDWPDMTYWVGGTDADHEGVWTWVDGTPMLMGTPYWAITGNLQYPLYDYRYNYAIMSYVYYYYLTDQENYYAQGHPICEM